MKRVPRGVAVAIAWPLAMAAAWGCGGDRLCDGDRSSITRPASWTRETHCPNVAPGYGTVFESSRVQRLDVKVSAADYDAAIADAKQVVKEPSEQGDLDSIPTPLWIPATVQYNGHTWTSVGMRYKGHASLKGSLLNGQKLSFLLAFDKYEHQHPELANQRFHGFSRLAFSNAYKDPSLIREKTAAGIFRAAGVPAARSAFVRVYLEKGDASGPVYMGLYTVVEDAADWMLASQLGSTTGNLYKPWGEAARWQPPSQLADGALQEHWEKQTNSESDWSDAEVLLETLHADRTDAATWRANLEKVFDVAAYLRVLSINQVMVNWDTYGCMRHNYMLYANPQNHGAFVWLPTDLNESMLRNDKALCVDSDSVTAGAILFDEILGSAAACQKWPLICYVLSDETYKAAYVAQVKEALRIALPYEVLLAQMQRDHELIAPYVVGPDAVEAKPFTNLASADAFNDSITGADGLGPLIQARQTEVPAALATAGY